MSQQLRLRVVQWFDRNAIPIIKAYNSIGTGAHATTTRWAYTVPKGRMAFCEFLVTKIQVHTKPTNDDYVQARITYTVKDGSEVTLIKSDIMHLEILQDQVSIGHAMVMVEGDTIKGTTSNLTTDGVYIYCVSAKLTEFDAFPIEALPFQVELPKVDVQEPLKSMVEKFVNDLMGWIG